MEKKPATQIWIYVDLRNNKLFGFSLNVLSKARELAQAVSGKAVVVIMNLPERDNPKRLPDPKGWISVNAATEDCIAHGADQVYVLDNPCLARPRADIYALAMADAVRTYSPMLVLFALTDFGRELAARAARINNSGLIADCADLRIDKQMVVAMCPSWGGQIMADITFSDNLRTGFATVQPHIAKPANVRGNPGSIERISLDNLETPSGPALISSSVEPEEHRKLEDAKVVVVGGAGMGNADNFRLVRELAAVLGGEPGATRPPVLQHWVDEGRLIGQTGKTVQPDLLLSIGTSGAAQYTAGITEAKTIVAINRDQNAPIFQVADLGIVGDAKTFLPLLTARIKQVTMRALADVLSEEKGAEGRAGLGMKVRKLRQTQNWSVEILAQNTGQSPEFISQVENDEVTPPVSFLLRLARAFEVDPGTFLHEDEKKVIRNQRTRAFVKRTQNYSYQALTPGAENEHLRAFMVTIEPRKTHKPVAYKHEGEEFILVMEGDLQLTLGSKAFRLKPGESMHFNSEIPHKLKSLSDETTRCAVVLYTP
ncbi:MAG: FAD-binding protein [Deltaproteobacteria bacterium]|nr:FAD-binding protein [Deltaproteobacteria bacterium]